MTRNQTGKSNDRDPKLLQNEETEEVSIDLFYVEEAISRAGDCTYAYQKTHSIEDTAGIHGAMANLAMARLEWAMEQGRKALDGLITEEEFVTLCNVFNCDLATPYDTENMASHVAHEFGIECDTYRETSFAGLLDKLMALSAIQKLALRDLVQRFWYPSNTEEAFRINEFMARNGVTAAPATA
jgi:hypothetical protein